MAFDETLAERIRLALADVPELYERLMFGGIAFMLSDHMTSGVIGDELLVRLGPEGVGRALNRPHVRRMDFTGRPMRSMVLVGPEGLRDEGELERWLRAGIAFVATLPPKRRGSAADPMRRERPAGPPSGRRPPQPPDGVSKGA